MAGIFKALGSSSKHAKLADKWGDHQHSDKVNDGVTYLVKYLGSTLVTELTEEGQSYGDHISGEAVDVVVSMAKSSNKKLPVMSLNISPRGITVIDTETNDVYSDLDIYRICFCTADRVHGKVFAYIARNKDYETMECHAFLCPKRKIAEAVTLTVAKSFRLAQDKEEMIVEKMRHKQQQQQQPLPSVEPSSVRSPVSPAAVDASHLGFEDNFIDMKVSTQDQLHTSASSSSYRGATCAQSSHQQNLTNTNDLLLL